MERKRLAAGKDRHYADMAEVVDAAHMHCVRKAQRVEVQILLSAPNLMKVVRAFCHCRTAKARIRSGTEGVPVSFTWAGGETVRRWWRALGSAWPGAVNKRFSQPRPVRAELMEGDYVQLL